MNSLILRPLAALVAAGFAFTSVSCMPGMGYWQQQQQPYAPNGYQQPQPQQAAGPQWPGIFGRRWNTDQSPRYGYNGQQQPYYPDPGYGGTQYAYPNGNQYPPNSQATTPAPTTKSKPKTKSSRETASTLHRREPTTTSKPKTTTTSSAPLPKGIIAAGKKGFVYSPYAQTSGMVDVEGIPAGTKVECPYTKKHFIVP